MIILAATQAVAHGLAGNHEVEDVPRDMESLVVREDASGIESADLTKIARRVVLAKGALA